MSLREAALQALRAALAEAPKAEPVALSDEDIERIWFEQFHLERMKGAIRSARRPSSDAAAPSWRTGGRDE